MLRIQPLDADVPIFKRIQVDQSPVILVNLFRVAEADVPAAAEGVGARRRMDETATRFYLYPASSRDWRQHHILELRSMGVCGLFPSGVQQP
jgi:hypothetical protein